MTGCDSKMESYINMRVTKLNGRPYLMLETLSLSTDGEQPYFSIYTPHGNSLDEWDPVTTDRLGPTYGIFICQAGAVKAAEAVAAAKQDLQTATQRVNDETDPEKKKAAEQALKSVQARLTEAQLASVNTGRIGVFHHKRVTLIDPANQPQGIAFDTLPFDWAAETAVEIKGKTYAFGVKMPDFDPSALPEKLEGTLKAARFDGLKWEDLKIDGPKVTIRTVNKGFSLQAVQVQESVKLLWREYEDDQALDQDIEGPRATTNGPVMIASFDAENFSDKVLTVKNLERGNINAWTEGAEGAEVAGENDIKLLIQSRTKLEAGIATSGPMVIWKISPDGGARPIEAIETSKNKNGLLPFIAAERFNWEGQEYIVRSDWQSFEIWQKTPEGSWTRRVRNPKGLPVYDLENILLTGLIGGFVMVAFGAILAYRQRRHAWTLVRKVQAREVYASLGLRMCAYLVDLGLVLAVVCAVARVQSWPYVSPVRMMRADLNIPYAPLFFIYMGYLSATEWLIGATLGKLMMGLCVVTDRGEKLSLWSALIRNFVGFFERLPEVAPVVSIFMVILGPKRQRLGDILARTFVVHKGALEAFKAQREAEIAKQKSLEAENPKREPEL